MKIKKSNAFWQIILSGQGNTQLWMTYAARRGFPLSPSEAYHAAKRDEKIGTRKILIGMVTAFFSMLHLTAYPHGYAVIVSLTLSLAGVAVMFWGCKQITSQLVRGIDMFEWHVPKFLDLFFDGKPERTTSTEELVGVVWSALKERREEVHLNNIELHGRAYESEDNPKSARMRLDNKELRLRGEIRERIDVSVPVGVLPEKYVEGDKCYADLFGWQTPPDWVLGRATL